MQPRAAHSKARRVEFRFYPEYIQAVLTQRRERLSGVSRGGVSLLPDSETLLLDASIPADDVTVFVRAWFIPAGEPDTFCLRVEVGAPQRIKRAMRIQLSWDNAEYVARLSAGVTEFEDITPPDFSRAKKNLPSRRLRLSFEFEEKGRDNNDSPEEK